MNKQEIIDMAREAGMFAILGPLGNLLPHELVILQRFAELVSAKEREACAKVCDSRYMGDNTREDMEARRCAAAIRARNNMENSDHISVEKMVEDWVVELSIDNGGYKPTIVELVEFLSERELSLTTGHFDFLVNKWCQK